MIFFNALIFFFLPFDNGGRSEIDGTEIEFWKATAADLLAPTPSIGRSPFFFRFLSLRVHNEKKKSSKKTNIGEKEREREREREIFGRRY